MCQSNSFKSIVGQRTEFVLAPALGAKVSPQLHAYWYSEKGRIKLVWTNSFSGLSMDLKRSKAGLSRTANTFWDFDRPIAFEARLNGIADDTPEHALPRLEGLLQPAFVSSPSGAH